MSSGRSDESNESDGEFKEVNLSDQDQQTKNEDSTLNIKENSEVLETSETFDNNRNQNEDKFNEKKVKSDDVINQTQNDLSVDTLEQIDYISCSTYNSLQKYHSVNSYPDEFCDFHSTESTPKDPNTVTPDLSHTVYTIQQHLEEDNTEQDLSPDHNLVVEDEENPDLEKGKEDQEEESGSSNEPDDEHDEQHKNQEEEHDEKEDNSSESESADSESNREKLHDGVPEFELSDHKSSERLSEPAVDGSVSDVEHSVETGSKLKHRKKFKSTSKTFESLFHKSSTGKSSKSKSKHSSTSSTGSSTKDNLVVTTTSTSTSSLKKKDKAPCWTNYEIPSKPGRKGPTLGVFYDSLKSWKSSQRTESGKDQKCIVLQTPDSLERYLHPFQVVSNYYVNPSYVKYYSSNVENQDGVMNDYYYVNMMTQRKSLLPYYVTKTIFGNIPGMGRVLVCGTQCGKIIFHSFFTLDELIVLDTRPVYDRYLSRENSVDSENGFDMNKAIDSTLFEVNCLSLINTFQSYSTFLAIGNHLGHLLIYQVPKMQLVKLIYPVKMSNTSVFNKSASVTNTLPSLNTTNSYSTYTTHNSICSLTSENDEILIDELELMRIRRYKNAAFANNSSNSTSNNNNGSNDDNYKSPDDEVVFITCLGYCSTTGDLWVGYGNGTFAIYSSKFKLRCFYNSNHLADSNSTNIVINNDNVYSVNNFEYCKYERIVLVLYGNVKLEIFTFDGTFLSTISCTRLTNNTIPVSTIHVYTNPTNHTILYIGLMDGSLLVKKILYNNSKNLNSKKNNINNSNTSGNNNYNNSTNNTNNNTSNNNNDSNLNTLKENVAEENEELDELLSNTIEFKLLYNLNYRFDGEVNFGAPVTSICPVPFQQLVLLGNASGGLSVISNLVT